MFYVGVDLGQSRDHTAIAVVERPLNPERGLSPERCVRSIRRVPLGTPFPEVVEQVRQTVNHPNLFRNCTLAVDATGIGAPIVEMMASSHLGVALWAVTITGGEQARKTGHIGGGPRWSVPKRDLLAGIQTLLERRQLRIPKELPNLHHLFVELRDIQTATLRADGAGQHDDLVIALSLACWRANQKEMGGHEGPLF